MTRGFSPASTSSSLQEGSFRTVRIPGESWYHTSDGIRNLSRSHKDISLPEPSVPHPGKSLRDKHLKTQFSGASRNIFRPSATKSPCSLLAFAFWFSCMTFFIFAFDTLVIILFILLLALILFTESSKNHFINAGSALRSLFFQWRLWNSGPEAARTVSDLL